MKYLFLILLTLFYITSCNLINESKKEQKNNEFEKALDAYPSIDALPKHQVLILGSFHFDRSRDGSDIVADEHIDIMSKENQKELDKIVSLLVEQFKPDKIAVEWRPSYQDWMDSLYTEYQHGNYKLGKHETFQLGFKIANKLGCSKVHCIDNNPPFPNYIDAIDDWTEYADSLGHLELWEAYNYENNKYNTFIDTIQRHLNVNEYLRLINSEQHSKRNKQLWTTGLVNVDHAGNYLGADVVGRWYTRNIRLFANAKNLVSENENLLIIYGGAHKWILDELFESAPDFEVIQFNHLEK